MKKIIILFIIFGFFPAYAEVDTSFYDKKKAKLLLEKKSYERIMQDFIKDIKLYGGENVELRESGEKLEGVLKHYPLVVGSYYQMDLNKTRQLYFDANRKLVFFEKKQEDLEESVLSLDSEKNQLQTELSTLSKKEYSFGELMQMIFQKYEVPQKFDFNDDNALAVISFYLFSSVILYIIVVVYTLPLRFIRWIWRKIRGYTPCSNTDNNKQLEKLVSKYRENKKELKNAVLKNTRLANELSSLKFKNSVSNASERANEHNENSKKESAHEEEEFIIFNNDSDNDEGSFYKDEVHKIISETQPIKAEEKQKLYGKFEQKASFFSSREEKKVRKKEGFSLYEKDEKKKGGIFD